MLLVMAAVPVPLAARTRAGEKFLKQGKVAEQQGDLDAAVELYQKAVATDPGDAAYLLSLRKARFQAGQKHIETGRKLRGDGKLEEALEEYKKAILSDPGSGMALQEFRRTSSMIEEDQKKQKSGQPNPDRGLTPAQQARKEIEQKVASMMAPPELKPITRTIASLKMNNQPPKVLYETVAKLAGINVVFDSQYTAQGRNFNVDLSNTTLDQALDYLAILTKTFWKPITANTIFIAEDNVTKRRDYEDDVVRVFYVSNATTVQEFQEVATAIRSVTEIRRVFTYNAQKALVVRGTVDQVALAEKLLQDLDKPKPEVVIDLIVMETNREFTRSLSASLQSGGTAGFSAPITFTPRNPVLSGGTSSGTSGSTTSGGTTTTTTTSTSSNLIALSKIAKISTNDFSTTVPGALLQAVMSDTATRVLQSPQIRSTDGQKATVKIGDRIPYATGSFQPGVGTVGVSPLVSTQFNYVDTGVNMDITPQVHSNDEITLHVELDVSAVTQRIDVGGLSQPVIGQRKATADLRLRDGEVNLMGGLSTITDSVTIGGIPGLVNIPILGKLFFGNKNIDRKNTDLLIAIIPHIVRSPDLSRENLRGIAAGTDQQVHITYDRSKDAVAAPAPTTPPATAPATTPALAPTAPPPAPSSPPPADNPTPPPTPSRMTFVPSTVQAQLSGPVTVTLSLESGTDMFAADPIRIKFDPALLRLNDVAAGSLLTQDGQRPTVSKDIRNDLGEATIRLSRLPGSPGISGSGPLVTFTFLAMGKGTANVQVIESSLKNSQLQPLKAPAMPLVVTVQ